MAVLARRIVHRSVLLQHWQRLQADRSTPLLDLDADAWGLGAVDVASLLAELGARTAVVSRPDRVAAVAADLTTHGVPLALTADEASVAAAATTMPAFLSDAVSLQARVLRLKRVPAGTGVSYGHRYVTPADTVLALLGIGYADGIDRAAGGHCEVLIAGQRRPIVGRVAMNVLVVDLGLALADEVSLGDWGTLFGPVEAGAPTVADWATGLGTQPAAVVTALSPTLQREWR